jgi:hypothetical protein
MSLLQDVKSLDYMMSQLHKIASRIRAGENVDAWREINGLLAFVDRAKQDLLIVSEKDSNVK